MVTADQERDIQNTETVRHFRVKVEPSDTIGREVLTIDAQCSFSSPHEVNAWVRACVDKLIVELATREQI